MKEAAARPSRGPDLDGIRRRARRRRVRRRAFAGGLALALVAGLAWAGPGLIETWREFGATPIGPAATDGGAGGSAVPDVASATDLGTGYLPEGFAFQRAYDGYFEEAAASEFFSSSYGTFPATPAPTPGQRPQGDFGVTASRVEARLEVDDLARFVPGARMVPVRGRSGVFLPAVTWGSVPPGGGHLSWQEREDVVVDVQAQGALGEPGLLSVAEAVRFINDLGLAFVLDRVPAGFQATGEHKSAQAAGDGTFEIPRPRGLTLTWTYRRGASPDPSPPVSRVEDSLWITAIHAPPRGLDALLAAASRTPSRVEPVTVRGREGLVASNGDPRERLVLWSEREGLFFMVQASRLSAEELMKIAEGLELR